MNIRSAKAKGRRASEELKQLILEKFKSLQDADLVVTPSSLNGPDLLLSPVAQRLFPFVVEVKNQEKISIWESIKQCESHPCELHQKPALFFKRNRSELYVVIKAEHLMELL